MATGTRTPPGDGDRPGASIANEAKPEVRDRGLAWRSFVPAGLAGMAEAGIVFLPLEALGRSSQTGGPLAWYPMFLVLFAGGVAFGSLYRGRPRLPAAMAAGCVAVGIVQSIAWNAQGGTGAFVAISLCLLAGIRMVSLALHDWRDPIDASFGWGAGALLAEIALARAIGWGDIVWPIAALFFVGSLGSRAASVRMVERSIQGAAAGPDSSRRWRVVGVSLAGTAGALTGLGLVLGTQRGLIDTLTGWLVEGLALILYGVAYVLAAVLSWLFQVLGIGKQRVDWLRRWAERLAHRLRPVQRGGDVPGGTIPLWERAIGVVVLFLLIGGLVYLVARQRRKANALADPSQWVQAQADEGEGLFARASESRRRRKLRNELPEDAVRRLYAQALDELEERGRPRSPAETPGEFLQTIRAGLPQCAAGMTVLTRAYEDVRYGRIALTPATIDSLEAEWTLLRREIRTAPLPEEAAGGDEGEATAAHMAERAEGAAGTAPSSDETFERR